MKNITNSENMLEYMDYVESFFKIRIGKIIMNDNKYKVFYKTFLDEKNEVNKEKINSLIDILYEKISDYDITNLRPNNISILDENSIKRIISSFFKEDWNTRFADDLFTFLEGRYSDVGLKIDYDIHSNKEIIEKVTYGFMSYIKNIYVKLNEGKELDEGKNFNEDDEIKIAIQHIEEKILKVLKATKNTD